MALSGATIYSRISASVPLMYLMKRTLLLRVILKIFPAVMSFLLMTASTPISSANLIYSIFSTSAIVFSTPNFFATTHARMFASSLPVTATKASKSLMPSSRRKSESRPSPLITNTLLSVFSLSSTHLRLSWSSTFTVSTSLHIAFATISPIGPAPRIITLLISMLLLPRKSIMGPIPSLVVMMKTMS